LINKNDFLVLKSGILRRIVKQYESYMIDKVMQKHQRML